MGTRTNLRDQNTSEIPVRRSKRWSHTRKEERVSESLEHDKDDEVVKYMSKLPGYLQGEDEESNVLNVGVLDWGRLEKWKQRGGRGKGGERSGKRESKVSATSTTLGTVPNGGSSSSHQYHHHRCKVDDQVHASSLLGKVKAASRGLQHSSHRVRSTLEPELASTSRDAFNKQEIATCSYNKSSSRKDRRSTSGLLPEMGNSNGSLGPKGNLVIRDKKESDKRAQEEARESGKQCAEKLVGEEKTLGDSNDNLKVTRDVSSRSVHFSDGISSSLGLRSQVPPPSSPLSFDLERDSEDLPLGVDLSCIKERLRHSKPASRIIDPEMREDESKKNRHTSPSKRFSFSFGRLSRNFTFKEDSSAGGQPLTSSSNDAIKSDSMRCDGSACPPQSSNPEEKHCGSSRVSPIRRLLDPLLKSKGSENVLPSKEERSTSTIPKPTNMDEKKQDTSRRTRALFQLTTRNGIPLFQFVVDDDNLNNNSRRSILGATMKNSDSSFKDDSVQYCTFYSVDEVKKKRSGSWLIHGHKEKQQRGFVYTVIGQMRLCNNSMSSDITEKNVSCIIREAVLVDETEEQVKGRKEVAAVVIKKKPAEENLNALEETTVIIPGGVHSFPVKGAPTPLVSRWRTGGLCDCGGWDVGCKLHVLSNKTLLHELDQSFKLFDQEESDQDSVPVLAMTELKTGMYRVEFGSFLSPLQAFFVCVTVITCASEEETVSKTTGRSSSPFAPPLSPVGRV
ncbi:hypothetical protein BRARA_C00047 [Brassica rapa]|uniref:DUF3527 domain-containing protein n=1 Tax=Brassica campestris TaxID=3711 RepID=A0A397ZRJ3_BRACM|nr:hypothetical protein BRARA_C00047 [Brassica rapa]